MKKWKDGFVLFNLQSFPNFPNFKKFPTCSKFYNHSKFSKFSILHCLLSLHFFPNVILFPKFLIVHVFQSFTVCLNSFFKNITKFQCFPNVQNVLCFSLFLFFSKFSICFRNSILFLFFRCFIDS